MYKGEFTGAGHRPLPDALRRVRVVFKHDWKNGERVRLADYKQLNRLEVKPGHMLKTIVEIWWLENVRYQIAARGLTQNSLN